MSWTRPDLIAWVQARMDEVSPTSQTSVISPSTIGKELDEGALQILRNSRKELVFPAATRYEQSTLIKSIGGVPASAIIPLTTDYVRFLRLKLVSHDVPIDELVSTDTNVYRSQGNQYQRATTDKPIAALIPFMWTAQLRNEDNRGAVTFSDLGTFVQAIEAFPAPSSLSTLQGYTEASYPVYNGSATGMVMYKNSGLAGGKVAVVAECLVLTKKTGEQMPDALIDPLVWLAAGRCLSTLREFEAAKVAYANFAAVMSEIRIGQVGEGVPVKGAK